MRVRPPIPFEVLSWLAPVLAPVEGLGALRHRQSLLWGLDLETALQQEEIWLGTRFPHHGEESLEEARQLVYQQGGSKKGGLRRGRTLLKHMPAVDPEWSPDLVRIFRKVGGRYLRWSGDRLVVLAGRLEELHHLALEFPVSHLVRHAHAWMVVRGQASAERLLDEKSWIGYLPTENRALAGLVERGLHEGHLHLNGLTSAEEMWADHLLDGSPWPAGGGSYEKLNLALARVSRVLLRLVVLPLLLYDRYRRGRPGESPALGDIGVLRLERAVDQLDDVCRRNGYRAHMVGIWDLERAVGKLVDATLAKTGRGGGWLGHGGEEMAEFLLAPERLLLHRRHHFPVLLRSGRYRQATDFERRYRAVEWLHLKLHQLLLELPSGRRWMLLRKDRPAREQMPRQGFEAALESYVDRIFLRYLVLQTYHQQLGTQHGGRMGLVRFRQYFTAPQRKPVDRDEWRRAEMVLSALLDEPRLEAVEGRVSPSPGGAETIRPWLVGLEQAIRVPLMGLRKEYRRPGAAGEQRWVRQRRRDLDFGLVVHFIKRPEGERGQTRSKWQTSLPRFHTNREQARRDALDLFRFLSRPDPQIPFVVGIDSCNLELAAPPEAFAPAFRFLRHQPIPLFDEDSSSYLRSTLFDRENLECVLRDRQLGMTFHVGEDFRHLLSGLRAIHEAMEFLGARPGDRLGHAIALGVAPESWSDLMAGQVMMPSLEWLDNLVWVRHLLGPGHDLLQDLRIEDQIQEYGARIYPRRCRQHDGAAPSPLDFYHAWLLRQLDPFFLERYGDGRCEGSRSCGSDAADLRFRRTIARSRTHERWQQIQDRIFAVIANRQPRDMAFCLHEDYLYSPEVWGQGEELISIELDDRWLRLCEEVQTRLRRELHRRHLVVEVNPMSNCTVGPMTRLLDHQVFRLTRPTGDDPAVFATVNTDDPGVFQTSLAHEFYLLGEALLGEGADECQVITWLESLRENGENYSFLKRLVQTEEWRIEGLLKNLGEMYGKRPGTAERWLSPESAGD